MSGGGIEIDATVDRELDEADRGRRRAAPLLALWGETGSIEGKDAVELWRPWSENVEGERLRGGHFVPEEQPDAVIERFRRFFAG